MPVFIDHLRTEIGTIEIGLQQLETHRTELDGSGKVRLGDLRLTLYGLRLVLMRSYLKKIASLLIPALELAVSSHDDPAHALLASAKELQSIVDHELPKLLMEVDASHGSLDSDALKHRLNKFILHCFQLVDFEINVLFPMAEERLDGLKQERLLSLAIELDRKNGFERVRGTQILMGGQFGSVAG